MLLKGKSPYKYKVNPMLLKGKPLTSKPLKVKAKPKSTKFQATYRRLAYEIKLLQQSSIFNKDVECHLGLWKNTFTEGTNLLR